MKPISKRIRAPLQWLFPLLLLTTAIAAPGVGTLWAGINQWTSLGPEGGSVGVLVVDPQNSSILYAVGGSGQLFKSWDGGANWKFVSSLSISVLAIDPQNTSTLYAGTYSGGIFRSNDAGSSWEPVNSGLRDRSFVSSLVIGPSAPYSAAAPAPPRSRTRSRSPSTLYAIVYWNHRWSVVKSSDGGESWSPADSGLPLGCCASLAIDPKNPGTLYLGTGYPETHGGLYRSTDGGITWTRAPAPEGAVGIMVIDPHNPSTIYAHIREGSGDDCTYNLFKSTDGGASWTSASSGLPKNIYLTALAIDPQNPHTLYASILYGGGVFKTIDGGASWSVVNFGLTAYSLAVDRQNTGTLYAGTLDGGVFKSTDGGTAWDAVNAGLIATDVSALAIDPQLPRTVYAAASFEGSSIAKSTDGGASWKPAGSGLPANARPHRLLIDPQNTSTIYAATRTAGGGLFKSTDGGASWVKSGFPFEIAALAIDPQNPKTLYASGNNNGIFGSVYKSSDGGANWETVNFSDRNRLMLPAPIPALVLVRKTRGRYTRWPTTACFRYLRAPMEARPSVRRTPGCRRTPVLACWRLTRNIRTRFTRGQSGRWVAGCSKLPMGVRLGRR